MSINLTSAIVGGAQTGFTTPGYTLMVDTPPDNRSRQSVVSAITGTAVGVLPHAISTPFTVLWRRPSVFKTAASAVVNGITGRFSKIPYNDNVILVRKAAAIAANQYVINEMRITTRIYAGTETYDAPNCKALISCSIGLLNGNSAGLGDTIITGVG